MKKIVVLLLLMFSTNVLAEWTRVAWNDEMIVYVDIGTIKKKGNKVKIWRLFDFKSAQISAVDNTSKFLSSLAHNEYECEEETGRQLDFYWYSGNMKSGDVVYLLTNINDEATSIMPESIDETLFKIACGNK